MRLISDQDPVYQNETMLDILWNGISKATKLTTPEKVATDELANSVMSISATHL